MTVQILSRNFIKPSAPTTPHLRNYKLSVIDEFAPPVNVPLILYYYSHNSNNGGEWSSTDTASSRCIQLKKSLEETLVHFYPLAGRYNKVANVIDCSDQGVEFVEARVDVPLLDYIGRGKDLKTELLNGFVPCEICAVDGITNPLLAIQVTMFECGGLAISFSLSHRVADATTLSMFTDWWATTCRGGERIVEATPPIFDSASFFPGINLPKAEAEIPEMISISIMPPKILTKRFSFSGKAISDMRDSFTAKRVGASRPSRVQLVIALIWKALIDADRARHGRSKTSFMILSVSLRGKTIPPIPKHSCGNVWALTIAQSEGDTDFHGLVDLVAGSIKNTAEDCKKMLSSGADGQMMVTNSFVESYKTLANPEVSTFNFTSWCRFPFYEADFGWGKTDWTSSVNAPMGDLVNLMDDKAGDGIEAWVNLDEKGMLNFKKDCDIRAFTN